MDVLNLVVIYMISVGKLTSDVHLFMTPTDKPGLIFQIDIGKFMTMYIKL